MFRDFRLAWLVEADQPEIPKHRGKRKARNFRPAHSQRPQAATLRIATSGPPLDLRIRRNPLSRLYHYITVTQVRGQPVTSQSLGIRNPPALSAERKRGVPKGGLQCGHFDPVHKPDLLSIGGVQVFRESCSRN